MLEKKYQDKVEKNKIAKDKDKIEQDRSVIAEEFNRVSTELEFIQNMSTVREQPTGKVKGKVEPVYDHQQFVVDNDSYEKFKSTIITSKVDRKILKYRIETNPQLSFTEIGKKVRRTRKKNRKIRKYNK